LKQEKKRGKQKRIKRTYNEQKSEVKNKTKLENENENEHKNKN
jgi:hypothetical protein